MKKLIHPDFGADVADMLADELSDGAVINSDLAGQIMRSMDIDIGQLMIMLLPTAAAYARVPVSNFRVGAIARGASTGNLYLGSNMEFTGHALSFSVHGEQSATNHAWLAGETGLQAVAVNAPPCGYCRQFLTELSTPANELDILLKSSPGDPDNHSYTMKPLSNYLPDAFGPADLGISDRLMQKQDHGLSLTNPHPLAIAALDAANASYSPYTNDYSGVAVQLSNGKIYAGRYAENAAYNPSMSPLASALAILSASETPQSAFTIVAAVLVEAGHASISQRSATEAVLTAVAPGVTLDYHQAT